LEEASKAAGISVATSQAMMQLPEFKASYLEAAGSGGSDHARLQQSLARPLRCCSTDGGPSKPPSVGRVRAMRPGMRHQVSRMEDMEKRVLRMLPAIQSVPQFDCGELPPDD